MSVKVTLPARLRATTNGTQYTAVVNSRLAIGNMGDIDADIRASDLALTIQNEFSARVAAINTLSDEVDTIIADSSTSSTEVVNARGGHTALDERIEDMGDMPLATALDAAITATDTSATVYEATLAGTLREVYAVVDAWTVEAEICQIDVSGNLIPSSGAFAYNHAIDDTVVFCYDGQFNVEWWGVIADDNVESGAELEAALAQVDLINGTLIFPGPSYLFDNVDMTDMQNIRLIGNGAYGATTIRFNQTTGFMFTLTDTRFITFENFNIVPNGIGKSSGGIFDLDGAGSFTARDLRMSGGFCGFRGRQNISVTQPGDFLIQDVRLLDYSTYGWPGGAFRADGVIASIFLDNVVLQSAVPVSSSPGAFAFIGDWAGAGNADTVSLVRCGYQKQSGGGATGIYIENGRWYHIENSFFECGSDAYTGIDIKGDAYGVNIINCHLLAGIYAIQIREDATNNNSPRGVQVIGGKATYSGRHGIFIQDAAEHIDIIGVQIAGNSRSSTDAYDGVYIEAGISHVQILGCRVGDYLVDVAGSGHRYGVYIEDGAGDDIRIDGIFSLYAVAPVYIGATGPNIQVNALNNPNTGTSPNRQAAVRPPITNRISTTDATPAVAWEAVVPTDAMWAVTAKVLVAGTPAGDYAYYERSVNLYNSAGTVTLGTINTPVTNEYNAALDCTFAVSGALVRLQVTGLAGATFWWHAWVEVHQAKYG